MEKKPKTQMISVFIMGKEHKVPKGLTIMKAIEYAGYQLVRGAGCRAGFCGACGTVYRFKEDYKFHFNLACQTAAEDGMSLTQLPFVPANKATYHVRLIKKDGNPVLKYYPEIARCVSCNTCTKACPQELEVMDYIQASLKNDIAKAAELSFDCIQCGMCTIRCPAEIVHYHVGQLARRIHGKFIEKSKQLNKRVNEINKGKYKADLKELVGMDKTAIKQKYNDRKIEALGH